MRTRNILLLILLVAGISAFVVHRMANAKTPKASERAADVTVEAKAIYEAFMQDETAAGKIYNDKVVQANGTVRDITTETDGRTNVKLNTGDALGDVVCEFAAGEPAPFQKNAPASIKGFCAGSTGMDVLLQRCSAADPSPANE